MLAMTNLANPVMIAVIIGWIMTVVLHELAHGLIAHVGGDYTIRQRGGLTLNPLQYIDPVNSILLPAVFLAIGGVPLPGGVTYIRTDLLKTKYWASAVSFAGPAMNFLLFFLLLLPFHPKIGWIHPQDDPSTWSQGQLFLTTLGMLQFYGGCLNLLPIPPLDGFGVISPFMDPETRQKMMSQSVSQIGVFVIVVLIWTVPAIGEAILHGAMLVLQKIGFDEGLTVDLYNAFVHTLTGH
jgi:Zn-dependent protease